MFPCIRQRAFRSGVKPEQSFKKVSRLFLQQAAATEVASRTMQKEEEQMRKLTYALAAVATLAIGAPTIANAAGFGVYVGGETASYLLVPLVPSK